MSKIYTAKITQKGQITLPAKLRKEKGWKVGSKLIFHDDQTSDSVKIRQKLNLYDTDFGNYDFQADLRNDQDLMEPQSLKGKEGWGWEND